MKNLVKNSTMSVLMLVMLFMFSCQAPDELEEIQEDSEEAQELAEASSDKPIFSMSFADDVSIEEADKIYEEKLNEFLAKRNATARTLSDGDGPTNKVIFSVTLRFALREGALAIAPQFQVNFKEPNNFNTGVLNFPRPGCCFYYDDNRQHRATFERRLGSSTSRIVLKDGFLRVWITEEDSHLDYFAVGTVSHSGSSGQSYFSALDGQFEYVSLGDGFGIYNTPQNIGRGVQTFYDEGY